MGCFIGRIHYGLKVVFCFKHFTAFHYHHYARLLTSTEYVSMFVEYLVEVHCIYVTGKPGICFRYHCALYDECKYSDTCWLADRTRLFVQYTISLSSLCKIYLKALNLWNACQIYFVECVSKIKIFSPLSIIQHVGLYVFSLPISLVMIERIYILCLIIIIKSEVWTYNSLFRVRSWNNGVRCMSSYILMGQLNTYNPIYYDENKK